MTGSSAGQKINRTVRSCLQNSCPTWRRVLPQTKQARGLQPSDLEGELPTARTGPLRSQGAGHTDPPQGGPDLTRTSLKNTRKDEGGVLFSLLRCQKGTHHLPTHMCHRPIR